MLHDFTENEKKILIKNIGKRGINCELIALIEELSELSVAVYHYFSEDDNAHEYFENLCEEMADVEIALQYLTLSGLSYPIKYTPFESLTTFDCINSMIHEICSLLQAESPLMLDEYYFEILDFVERTKERLQVNKFVDNIISKKLKKIEGLINE